MGDFDDATMDTSILDFLISGTIGGLRLGLTAEEVQALLGPPDDVGGTSRKYPRPTVYVYGSIEVFFTQPHPTRCVGLWWYVRRGPFRLAAGDAGEQLLTPGMHRKEVEARLANAGLTFHAPVHEKEVAPTLILASGVTIVLDENDNDRLYAVAVSAR